MKQLKTGTDLIPAARLKGNVLIADISGELNLHNSPDLRAALLDLIETHTPQRVILNLADVAYMDSSALAVLIEMLKRVRRDDGTIYLTSLQPPVRGLLEIARLDSVFVVVDTEQAALEHEQ